VLGIDAKKLGLRSRADVPEAEQELSRLRCDGDGACYAPHSQSLGATQYSRC
jgi:hypothetical protein